MLQKQSEDPEESQGARTQPCLTPLQMLKGSEVLPLNCTVSCMLQLWWAANLWQDFEKALSADEVGRLGEIFLRIKYIPVSGCQVTNDT